MVAERYYLDSNILIELFDPKKEDRTDSNENLAQSLQKLLAISLDKTVLATGDISYAEVLVRPIREENRALVDLYTLFFQSDRFWIPGRINLYVLFLSAQIRATSKTKIKTPDALQLATAYDQKCTHFLTFDKGIPHGAFEFTNARFENLKHGEWRMEVLAPDIAFLTALQQQLS